MKCARWFSNSSGEPNRFRFADCSTEERILLLVALGRWCVISARLLRAQRGIPLVTHRVYKVTYSLSLDRAAVGWREEILFSASTRWIRLARYLSYGIAIAHHSRRAHD